MDEFRNREAGSGVGKLKWDAQVRMRQAKLRSSGQKLSRNDTVMLMMEEAINRATDEIVEKFEAIAEGTISALLEGKASSSTPCRVIDD